MKRLTTLLFLLSCAVHSLFAQTEFSKEGVLWKVHYENRNTRYPTRSDMDCFYYMLKGDTLIDDQRCLKLYFSSIFETDTIYVGSILEAGKKVWLYPNDRDEETGVIKHLLYDFSLEKGDTFRSDYALNIFTDLRGLYIMREPFTATVVDVSYDRGRKKIVLSDGDCWIEGIGSVYGFLGNHLMQATDGSSKWSELTQVVNDQKTVYMQGAVITDEQPSAFLRPGMVWHVRDMKGRLNTWSLGSKQWVAYYSRYPLYDNGYFHGYLLDVNGAIYFQPRKDDHRLEYEFFLYTFNLVEGEYINLWVNYGYTPMATAFPTRAQYKVEKIDQVNQDGQSLRRFHLKNVRGDWFDMTWVENIGSLKRPVYISDNRASEYEDIKKSTLSCCHLGVEWLYRDSDVDGCSIQASELSPGNYALERGVLTIEGCEGCLLSIRTIDGQLIDQIQITSERAVLYPKGLLRGAYYVCQVTRENVLKYTFKALNVY